MLYWVVPHRPATEASDLCCDANATKQYLTLGIFAVTSLGLTLS
jgi:hypothetical protein